jgi:hypothetical protein
VSNPRSGSTALRKALAAGGSIKDFGEIFHDNHDMTDLPFLEFLERWRDPLLAVLDWSECLEISRAYVRQLSFAGSGQQPLIDVKHNAWGVLRPLWQFPHDEPLFMTALKEKRAIFVQLKREHLADQIISYIIAMNSGIWHSRITNNDIPDILLGKPLEAQLVQRLCMLFDRGEALTEELLAEYPHRVTISYERAFSDGALSSEAASLLGNITGTEIRRVALPVRPNAVANRQIISNYDEVCAIAASIKSERSGCCASI